MQGIIVFAIVLGALILVHEFGHFIVARKKKVKVERFSIGFGPKLFSMQGPETEYRVSLIPLGGYVKMAGDEEGDAKGESDEFLSKPVGTRAAIVVAGPVFNYLLSFVIFCFVFFIGSPVLTPEIGEVLDSYPAQQTGLKAGDVIVSIDSQKVLYWDEIPEFIQKGQGKEISIEIVRDGKRLNFLIEPVTEERQDLFGDLKEVALIGVSPSGQTTLIRYSIVESIYKSAETIVFQTRAMLKIIGYLITGRMDIRESLAGPIGIFVITKEAAKIGMVSVLTLVAVLGVNLAVINLLPIPVLDGGHILFLAIEKIRRRPLPKKVMEISGSIGLTLLLILMAFILFNDFIKFDINIIEKIKNLW